MRALVLNASYEPIKIVSWQKAILLWFQGKVEVIEHHDVHVRSVNLSFQLPSVIILKRFVKTKKEIAIRFSRENVYLRDNYSCQYCDREFSTKELTLDHVLPVSLGGKKSWHNIVTACKACNQKKGNKTPEEAKMPLKKLPSTPRWLPKASLDLVPITAPTSWRIYFGLEVG